MSPALQRDHSILKTNVPRWAFLFIAACLASAAFAQGAAPSTIGVDEIRPGMRGHGLTVFRGETPERFDVEVVGVLHGFRPDQDLILVRTPHPVLNHARAVGGMSGSPIYIDGRLAGAYAYGWQFGQDPVVGVTPIRNMLAEIDRPVRPSSFPGALPATPERAPAQRARRSASLAGLPAWRGADHGPSALDALRAHADRLGLGREVAEPNISPQPAGTPLMLGGFDPQVASMLGRELSPFGWIAMQGGGTGQAAPTSTAPRYVDGGAIGVQLVSGDISATAVGTVTHVGNGNRLIAFGHPMMNAGEIGLPTATARVVHIFASAARSFKIAEAAQPLGTLVHDRQAAIVVDTDLNAGTVPVRLRITGVPDTARTEWNMRVASHRMLTPVLLFGAINNAIKAAASDQTDVMFTATARIQIAGHQGPIEVVDRGYMGSGPADSRALSRLRVFELLEIAYGNPFVESWVERMEIDLAVEFGDDVYQIVEASTQSDDVDPGSTVPVRVRLRRYGREDVVRVIPIQVPAQAAGQTVRLSLNGGGAVQREQPIARSMDDLIERTLDHYPDTSLVVSLKMPSRGLRFRGHVASSLPRSALNTLQQTSGSGPGRPFITQRRTPVDLGEVVVGRATINLRVRNTARAARRGERP